MTHKPVTHAPIPMPRISGLISRSGRYYLNVRVPKNLRGEFNNKDIIRKALGTSERDVALARFKVESLKVESDFAAKRRELRILSDAEAQRRTLASVSEEESLAMVSRWFIEMEKRHQSWWDAKGRKLDKVDLIDPLDDLRVEEAGYMGGTNSVQATDCDATLELLLKSENIDPDDSPAFQKLSGMLQRAVLESLRRSIDRIEGQPISTRESLFRGVFAHSPLPVIKRPITLGELLNRHAKQLSSTEKVRGTHQTYRIPYRLLVETFGKNAPLDTINKDGVEILFRLLRHAPANATQRYPGLTLKQSVAAADKAKDSRRLGSKTLDNYYINISAIFNFAVTKELMTSNPAKDKYLLELLRGNDRSPSKRKARFSINELNLLFRTPLYVGCVDDLNGYAKPGNFRGRRGRFWMPLLALFHGLRCNEVAQLYTEDIKEIEGIPCLHIRVEREDGSGGGKRLKTKQSARLIPIHSELIRLGFLKFIEERRLDQACPRLFNELEIGRKGYFSDSVSKWFSRFAKDACGDQCKSTFHSFRHLFRTSLREAGVSIEDAEQLGGWKVVRRSAEEIYDHGASMTRLKLAIEKVTYPGLDLSHLPGEFCNRFQPMRVPRKRGRRMQRISR